MTVLGQPRVFHKKFKFRVECNGIGGLANGVAGFRSCSELSHEIAKVEYSEGGTLIPNKSPGRVTFSDITLERGATQDRDNSILRRWRLNGAWPVKFVGGDWDNEADENVIESVTLTYDFYELVQAS
jgi:hypothetical protein